MSKKNLIFAGIEIEKNKFYRHVDIEKVLVSTKNFLVKRTVNTILITYIMIIKLSHHI